jgi:pyrimidine deaminase RibD-like protein
MQQDNMDARKYMAMAIEVMNKSIQEPRSDKVSPKVGAVLIKLRTIMSREGI